MLSKFIYYEFLTYNRKHFNGMIWYYHQDDADEIDNLDIWESVYDDLLEYNFAGINVHL